MTIPRRGIQRRGPRRVSDWGLGPSEEQTTTISATGRLLWATAISPSQNLTIVRTRGFVAYTLLSGASAGDGFFGASGICMLTDAAVSIGVTAVPDPLTEANSDVWLWHSYFDIRLVTATISDGVNASGAYMRQVIDSKAMRKDFDPTRTVVGITTVREQGVSTMVLNADCRMLFKT